MEQAGWIFIGLALAAAVLAVVLARLFSGAIKRDRENDDLNADRRDGRGSATWIGIDRSNRDDDLTGL